MCRRCRARNQVGATAVEYALLLGLIALVLVAAITTLGGNLAAIFTDIGSSI